MSTNLRELLEEMVERDASDLYITVDCPPMFRVEGVTSPWGDRKYTPEETEAMAMSLMSQTQKTYFARRWEMNLAISYPNLGRFRVNIFRQRGYYRHGPPADQDCISRPSTISGCRRSSKNLSMTTRGLVLVAGRTGSGKSTTLAAIIDYRNSNAPGHIVTVEDPIEFVHSHKKSIVTQREIGIDTHGYASALKHTLRQAPDVILIGEIRDVETMEAAIDYAETGHLCLGTIHANNANQAIERIMNFFPPERHTADLSAAFLEPQGHHLPAPDPERRRDAGGRRGNSSGYAPGQGLDPQGRGRHPQRGHGPGDDWRACRPSTNPSSTSTSRESSTTTTPSPMRIAPMTYGCASKWRRLAEKRKRFDIGLKIKPDFRLDEPTPRASPAMPKL